MLQQSESIVKSQLSSRPKDLTAKQHDSPIMLKSWNSACSCSEDASSILLGLSSWTSLQVTVTVRFGLSSFTLWCLEDTRLSITRLPIWGCLSLLRCGLTSL